MSIHSVSFKIRAVNPINDDGIQSVHDFAEWFTKWKQCPNTGWVNVLDLTLNEIRNYLTAEGHNVRMGVRDGCYGSSTGEIYDGLTVYVDADELPSRFECISDDGDVEEWVNFVPWFKECGGELIYSDDDDISADKFAEIAELLGLEVKHDNSYNYLSHSNEMCVALYDIDFKWIENNEGTVYLAVMFHHGGDPRGNYGERVLFQFDSIDDAHSAICPTIYGRD